MSFARFALGPCLLLSTSGLLGCSSSDEQPPAGDAGVEADAAAPPPMPSGLPALDELEEGKFTFVPLAGETRCAKGSEYGFAVMPGDPNRVVVEFEGGGACWNEQSCKAEQLYLDNAEARRFTGNQVGIRKHQNADNPFADWTHVVLPYCTADLHWGSNDADYNGLTLHHQGAINTRSVLEWLYAAVPSPERVFVTGCSAGGYGSIYWTPELASHFSGAKVQQFSDAAAGVLPDAAFGMLKQTWGIAGDFPLGPSVLESFGSLPELYAATAEAHPSVFLSQYNALTDSTQSTFYRLMGGQGDWSAQMLSSLGTLRRTVPSFRSFTEDSSVHCVIADDRFFSNRVGEQKLTAWLGDVIADRTVANVDCPDCAVP